jgi:fatty acid desaturase
MIPLSLRLTTSQLAELRKPPWWSLPLQLLFILGGYAGLAYVGALGRSPALWLLVWWFQGVILSGFLGAAHDCAHGKFVHGRVANHVIGAVWASLVFFNFSLYKYFHLKHHRYTAVDGDTEPNGLFPNLWSYLKHLPTTSFFLSFWKMSIESAMGHFPDFVATPEAKRDVQLDNILQLMWFLTALLLTILWPKFMALYYWAPMAFYFPMVFLTSLPEHYGCDQGNDVQRNTRTVTSNWMFRLVFWNGNYHAEHHLYPNIPSWNLPRLHKLIGHRFSFVEKSYIRFHLRLIWDLLNGHRQNARASTEVPDPSKRINYTPQPPD